MEKTWKEKLTLACAEYANAKSDSKREKFFNRWKEVSREAMTAAGYLAFEEILSWLNLTVGIEGKDYFSLLMIRAKNEQQRLLISILSGQAQSLAETKVELLTDAIENIFGKFYTEGLDETLRSVVRERPDILLYLKEPILKKLFFVATEFPKDEKLKMFLNYFTSSEQMNDFANLLNKNSPVYSELISNQEVLEQWNGFSDQELASAEDFGAVMKVYRNASLKWKTDLKNFKSILKRMDHQHFPSLLAYIKSLHGETSFYYVSTVIAKEKWVEQKLVNGEADFRRLFSEAPEINLEISNTKRKIIEKFLE